MIRSPLLNISFNLKYFNNKIRITILYMFVTKVLEFLVLHYCLPFVPLDEISEFFQY